MVRDLLFVALGVIVALGLRSLVARRGFRRPRPPSEPAESVEEQEEADPSDPSEPRTASSPTPAHAVWRPPPPEGEEGVESRGHLDAPVIPVEPEAERGLRGSPVGFEPITERPALRAVQAPEEGAVLSIGRNAPNDALRTSSDVDLALRFEGGQWSVAAFDLGGIRVTLGPVPVRLGPLSVTPSAQVLRLEQAGGVEQIDLSAVAASPECVAVGDVKLAGPPLESAPSLEVFDQDGVVMAVSIPGRQVGGDAVLGDVIRTRRAVWSGDAAQFVRSLRLDLLQVLGWWPRAPEGASVVVAACGPGAEQVVWATTDDRLAFSPAGSDLVLVVDEHAFAIARRID